MLVVQLWKLTEVIPPISQRDDADSDRSGSVPSEELESVSLPEFPSGRNENSPNRRGTVTDLIGDFELGDTILHETPDSLPTDAENYFQAEVTVQGHFSLDVSTSDVASARDVDILADIAIIRLINTMVNFDNNESGVLASVSSSVMEILEVLVSMAI